MKILFIGDVQGQANILKLKGIVPRIKREEDISFVIINGENSADTNGIHPKSAHMLFNYGCADVITTGNHCFKRKEMDEMFDERREILRPANYGDAAPGRGWHVIDFGAYELCVINLAGMVFMPPCDNPFRTADEILAQVNTPNIVVDFHAEATSEKRALAEYLSGKVSAVLGTHTHVQTADEQILDGHTAFITDVGMVGAADSVIGAGKNEAIKFMTTYYPQKLTAAEGVSEFNAVTVEIDVSSGRAVSIKRIKQILQY
jgi:hypothetical protein